MEVQDGEEGPTVPAWRVHRVAHGSPRPGAGKKSTGGRERDKAVQVLGQTLASLHRPEAVKEAEAYRDTVTLAHYAAGHLEKKAVARRAATVDRDRRSLGLPKGIVDAEGVADSHGVDPPGERLHNPGPGSDWA